MHHNGAAVLYGSRQGQSSWALANLYFLWGMEICPLGLSFVMEKDRDGEWVGGIISCYPHRSVDTHVYIYQTSKYYLISIPGHMSRAGWRPHHETFKSCDSVCRIKQIHNLHDTDYCCMYLDPGRSLRLSYLAPKSSKLGIKEHERNYMRLTT